jgi:hypothetical protein
MDSEIDTFNKHMVGVQGDNIVIMMLPRGPMSKADALVFAAWIVTLADDHDGGFQKVLAAVQS